MISLLFLLLLSSARAWVPPKPGSGVEWEPVDAMRERLGIQFNYTPSLLHPEICRYMTEEECQRGDENLQTHAKAHRALQEERKHNPNLGTFKVLVLLIVFEDHINRPRIAKSDVELMWNTLVPEWFDVNSNGNYDIEPVVTEWVVTDNTEKYYAFGKTGVTPDFQRAAWPALDALDNTPGWDWSIFDLDQDNKLDSVVITHSGYGAETVLTDEYNTPYNERIWAHAFAQSGDAWTSSDGSVSLNGYTVASALEYEKGTTPATIGLTVHEYMHTFAVMDLYDTTNPSEGSGIGGFDVMANPYGPNGNANFPGHLSTWSKMEAGWITPQEITTDGTYTLQPLETTSEGYQIMLGTSFFGKSEYLLFENRQKLEFDLYLYGSGLAIYHIDDGMDGQKSRGYPGQVDDSGVKWPDNGLHYQVAMLSADGEYDLEQAANRGDQGDLWQAGQSLGPGQGNTVFPNTDRYADAWVQESGITITVLEPEGQNVRFQVSGLGGGSDETSGGDTGPSPTTESPSQTPTKRPSVSPSLAPTATPTATPTASPSLEPTPVPSGTPSAQSSDSPTMAPSAAPTMTPSAAPTDKPSLVPSDSPSLNPTTLHPTAMPGHPTHAPSEAPTHRPSLSPSAGPTESPSVPTSNAPTVPTGPLFNTIGKEPSTSAPETDLLNPNIGLLQPPEDSGVIATDFDTTPAPTTPQGDVIASLRPVASPTATGTGFSTSQPSGVAPTETKSPTPAPFFVAIDMTSNGRENNWSSGREDGWTHPDLINSSAVCAGSGFLWTTIFGYVGLSLVVLVMDLY